MLTTNAGSTTTYFVGNYYELTGSEVTKYYYAGSQRVAMRKNGTLTYILTDHLGSTSLVTDANGVVISEVKYKAWGEVRYSSGAEQTKYTYTGQYSYVSDFGLHFYNARWYDPSLSRFAQADTIVAGGVQGLDRYAYVNNNPVLYLDPSGHMPCQSSYCDPRWANYAPPVNIAFAGSGVDSSGNVNIELPNTVNAQIPLYGTNQNGDPIIKIDYPGYTTDPFGNRVSGKQQQFRNAQGKAENVAVNLICYSAGAEACLMYARWRISNNQKVNSVTLLGPTFVSYRENDPVNNNPTYFGDPTTHDGNFDDWADYVDHLIQNNVDVLVVSDGGDGSLSDVANSFVPSQPQQGVFTYTKIYQDHYSTTGIGTNNNQETKRYVYDWIFQNSQR